MRAHLDMVALAGGLFLAIHPAQGQTGRWSLGGGPVIPSGEYSMHDKAGWHALASLTPVGASRGKIALRIDALYGRTGRKTTTAATSQVFGLDADLVLRPMGTTGTVPYVLVGLGYYELEEGQVGGGSSQPVNGIALNGGVGLSLSMGGVRAFIEGRFIGAPVLHGVDFIPFTIGVSLGGR